MNNIPKFYAEYKDEIGDISEDFYCAIRRKAIMFPTSTAEHCKQEYDLMTQQCLKYKKA